MYNIFEGYKIITPRCKMTIKEFYKKHDLSGYILDRIKFDTFENEILFLLLYDMRYYNEQLVCHFY